MENILVKKIFEQEPIVCDVMLTHFYGNQNDQLEFIVWKELYIEVRRYRSQGVWSKFQANIEDTSINQQNIQYYDQHVRPSISCIIKLRFDIKGMSILILKVSTWRTWRRWSMKFLRLQFQISYVKSATLLSRQESQWNMTF